jgi:hypothetical protein
MSVIDWLDEADEISTMIRQCQHRAVGCLGFQIKGSVKLNLIIIIGNMIEYTWIPIGAGYTSTSVGWHHHHDQEERHANHVGIRTFQTPLL